MSNQPNRSFYYGLLGALLLLVCASFGLHKFYVGIYQVDYVPAKKRLQISMRLFVDDCNAALQQQYKQKTNLGDKRETAEEVNLLNTYLALHFKLALNGKQYPLHFKRKELENNVLVCYFTCDEVAKFSKVEIENTIFTAEFPEQQNILQVQLFGKKQSALLTQSTKQAAFFPD